MEWVLKSACGRGESIDAQFYQQINNTRITFEWKVWTQPVTWGSWSSISASSRSVCVRIQLQACPLWRESKVFSLDQKLLYAGAVPEIYLPGSRAQMQRYVIVNGNDPPPSLLKTWVAGSDQRLYEASSICAWAQRGHFTAYSLEALLLVTNV